MEIKNNINSGITTGASGLSKRRTVAQNVKNDGIGDQSVKTGVTQSSSLRELSESLMIRQKAQIIVQQALNVSARLQNISRAPASSSRQQFNDVGRELQNINSSLGEYGSTVTPPPVQNEVRAMKEMVDKQSVDSSEIGRIYSKLDETNKSVTEQLEAGMRQGGITEQQNSVKVAELIQSKPAMALAAQGNIPAERVGLYS